jgi:hypothetical protein
VGVSAPLLEQDPCETDGMRMCELLVGLPTVTVFGVVDLIATAPLVVHIETRLEQHETCPACGATARLKDRDAVMSVDLPAFGRTARLVWRKRRWLCPTKEYRVGSWTKDGGGERRHEVGVDGSCGAVGDLPGWPSRPQRERGRGRSRE